MKRSRRRFPCPAWLAVMLTVACGCSTLQYRTVQRQFEDAVRSDNERFTLPFTDVSARYRAVADQLTPAYVDGLHETLKPNAWMIRGFSQWRGGAFSEALSSALEGQAEIARLREQSPQVVQGRDSILLTMLPGLVEDSRLRERFKEQGPPDGVADYKSYADKFRTALRALSEARHRVGGATPEEVVAYWHYQCWRVLQNWGFILAQLPAADSIEAHRQADAVVTEALVDTGLAGVRDLPTALAAVETSLSEANPYRQLMELERQR